MKKLNFNGFTLVELLIASSIFVIVMVTVYSAFHTGMFGYKNIDVTLTAYQAARQTLERLNSDVRNTFGFSQTEAGFSGDKSRVSFFAITDTFDNGGIKQDYSLISYQREGDKLMRLCRREKESLNNKSEIKAEEISADVEDIIFNYGYVAAGEDTLSWKDSWGDESASLEEKEKLPAALKVKLIIKNAKGFEFERTIFLPLGSVNN